MGPAVAKVHRALGRPMMPWQEQAANVGGQVTADGRFVWPLVVVSVPRQSGKTTLMLAQSIQRCLARERRKTWTTAQTGQDARKKWKEMAEEVMASPLRSLVAGQKYNKSNGAESLAFVNGSVLRPFPPTRDALHGEQSDQADVDEGWAFSQEQGDDLIQAITPTQLTRPGAQTWVWSTRGDRHSEWFHGLIERGYAGEPGILLIDYGIPDDADPMDLELVAAHHPAIGHTVTMDSLRAAQVSMADKPGEFARAYGNRATGAGERILPAEDWAAAATEAVLPPGRPAFGVATARDGSASAIAVAVLAADGRPWVEVIAYRPGRSWAVDQVRQLRDAGQGVAVNRSGPAAPIADQLQLADVPLIPVGTTEYQAACIDLLDRITHPVGEGGLERRIVVRSHPALDDAADIAARRFTGDGGWVWNRMSSAGDIAALEAATLAAWAVLRNPVEVPAPFVVFG